MYAALSRAAFARVSYRRCCTSSGFKVLKQLSTGGLSEQFPLRLIDALIPWPRHRAWDSWLHSQLGVLPPQA